jgi:alpha-D-xyloside xylohydrolase
MSNCILRRIVEALCRWLPILLLIDLASPASAVAAGATAEGQKLVYRDGGQTVVIQAWGRDGLRVRVTPAGGGQTSDWALDIPLEAPAQIAISDTVAVIRNGNISARIQDIPTQRGHLQFFRHRGEETVCILSEYDYVVHAHNPGPRTFRPVGDGLFHCELHFAARDGERFYGMGENATGRVNLKGSVIDLYQRHVKAVVPFVVSSEGYGFLWNNPALGRVEFGENRTRWVSYGSKQLDYYITAGESYADILANYVDATGHAPPFPFWASGFWQCKLRYQSQAEFLNVAREFKRRGLPLAVLVIDFLHWDVTGNWKLDPKFWPDPPAMVRELDAMGVRIMISPWTLVDEKSENFAYMRTHGLFTGSIGGKKDTVGFGGPKYQYDPTNPEAAKYLWSKWKQNYFDLGIRTFWLDPCDEFHEIADYDQVLFHIGPAKESHAFFPVAHQRNIYEGLLAAGEKEVVTICRNAWAGSQRYGACPAPHDIESSFEHLEEYMKVGLNVMMSGIPWWSCDIGGFVTRDNQSPRFQELMVRWYQYGVFLPVFRTHGCRPNNEPWNIGGDTYPLIRSALLLRERLRGYIMEQMKLASERGLPPMRPLFFDFAHDPQAAAVEDQFLFGPDILVAPVTKFGMRRRVVYLPAGTPWTDAWTGKVFPGGQAIQADAPLEYIPVFIRGSKPKLLELFRTLEIFSFHFGALGPAAMNGTEITIRVPHGTALTSLCPTYTASPGTTGHPASGSPADLTHPQVYRLTGADGATKEYRVSVRPSLIYNFNDGTLQGWHNRVWDSALNAGQGGWADLAANATTMPQTINGGQLMPASGHNAIFRNAGTNFMGFTSTYVVSGSHLDHHRNTLWLRSPEFRLDGSGDLTFELLAGTGAGAAPTADFAVPFAAGDIDATGWIGLCLRDVTTGAFVLSAQRSNRDFNHWQPLAFTAAQLAKLPESHAYTLDLLLTGTGIWSWVGLDNVCIPGVLETATRGVERAGAKK